MIYQVYWPKRRDTEEADVSYLDVLARDKSNNGAIAVNRSGEREVLVLVDGEWVTREEKEQS